MQWLRQFRCFINGHNHQPIKSIWVRYRQPMYFENEFAQEGENIVSKLYCPNCGDVVMIEVKK